MRPFMDLFRSAWARFNQRLPLFLAISAIGSAVSLLTAVIKLIPAYSTMSLSFSSLGLLSGLSLVGIVLGVWSTLALYTAVALPDQAHTISQAFQVGGTYFFKSFTTGLLVVLWVILGLILLIIPGIYWGVLYCLAAYVVFIEKLYGTAALDRSKQLVKPYWTQVFVRQLLLGLLIALPMLVLVPLVTVSFNSLPGQTGTFASDFIQTAFSILVTPLAVIFLSEIYKNLVELQPRT